MEKRLLPQLSRTHLLFFFLLALLLTACGLPRESWAGVTATDNGEVYVSFERFIAQVNAQGERQWLYPPRDQRDANFYANVTVTEAVVYVGDYKGGVHAINRKTGERIWAYTQRGTELFGLVNFGGTPDRIIGGVAVGDGVLFVPDEAGVFLLSAATGERDPKWILETERAVWSKPVYVPASEGQAARLFVTSLDHYLYAVNPENAEILWKTDLGGAIPDSPLFLPEANLLLVGTFKGEVVALSAEKGEIIATFETKGWVWDTPALFEDTLYFGDLKGYLYAVRYADGAFTQVWSQEVSPEGQLRATPLVTEELVLIGSDDRHLYAVRRDTGELEWEEDIEERMVSPLVLVEGEEEMLVVTASDKRDKMLVALRLDNGNERWVYEHKD
jgi:outer membrane protein assembly factor BamB